MSANFTPEEEDLRVLSPFKMQVLTNFPYIEADFDALTNYQLLCKVVEYLNNVITNENEVTAQVTSLYNAYVSLQNYVNTYFDNLDLQEEVSNKLDEMALNGTITNLIKDYIDPLYQAYELEINGLIDNQNNNINNFKLETNVAIQNIDNKVESATSGSPAGSYATVAALAAADPDHSKIYVVIEDGKWYYYNTSTTSWTAGGDYLSSVDTDTLNEVVETLGYLKAQEITPDFTDYVGYVLDPNNGYLRTIANNNFKVAVVEIPENAKTISVNNVKGNQYVARVAFFATDDDFTNYQNVLSFETETTDGSYTYTIPTNAHYVLIQNNISGTTIYSGDSYYFNYEDVDTRINAINEDIGTLENVANNIVPTKMNKYTRIVLPYYIYTYAGDTLHLYFDSFIESSEKYTMVCSCPIGKQMKDYYEVTPTLSDAYIGNFNFVITLYDLQGNVIATKTSKIRVQYPQNPVAAKHILCIGDSTMAEGQIPIESSRVIAGTVGNFNNPTSLNLSNYKFKGRLHNTANTVGWEGTPGFTIQKYLGEDSPFYNSDTGEIDISTYINSYCNNQVDMVAILLGINNLVHVPIYDTLETITGYMDSLVDTIHEQLPSAKILLSTVAIPSEDPGANYSTSGYVGSIDVKGYKHKILNFNAWLISYAESLDYVDIINNHAETWNKYCYPFTERTFSDRYNYTIKEFTNVVHPTANGYAEWSDSFTRTIVRY